MKKIIALLSLILPILTYAQSNQDIKIREELKQKIVGNSSMHVKNQIYFNANLRNKTIMCQKKNIVGFIDEEGGNVNRFKESWEMSSPEEQAKMSLVDFKNKTNDVAKHLKNYCVSVNLGVLGDTYKNKHEMIYAGRSYSIHPSIANQYANVYADSLRKVDIVPGWKHFPGHTENIHPTISHPAFRDRALEQSADTSSLSEIKARARAFNNNGNHDILMISQTIYPAISNRPAVLSPDVVALAHKIQPNSRLMTDDLSELNLTDKDILFLYRNYDLLLFSDEKSARKFENVILQAKK